MENLGTLPNGNHSRALSINDRGEVVGLSNTPKGIRAFLWTRNSGMQDLNTLIPADSDFVLEEAVGINDLGVILAIGYDKDDEGDPHRHESPTRVFLLVP
jgi:probable HAF family extracellular repeat protein